ncbi:helix-turn-helix transcriptional regulator [Aeromicrobium sp.]|uniref:helix-turn-helix transcriptional regulator n=1 Tax=Aeromicrobium sp. TaxID=1871063 RepID=UPI003D6BD8F8
MSDFLEQAAGIGALADPLRRDLYVYVCAQDHAVGRGEAAEALDLPLHRAKFHLERLAHDGLLDVEFARLSGRSGPGAGRPSKLYRRATREIAVSLPGREYELAGRLMAEAIAESGRSGTPVLEALSHVASEHGRTLGQAARATAQPRGSDKKGADALGIACAALAEHGYEPRIERRGATLGNCPFHALAASHTDLVCQMNLSLIEGLVDEIATGKIEAHLDPAEDRCCVTLAKRRPGRV